MDLMLVVFHFPRFLHFDFSSNEIYIVMLKQALSLHSIDSMDPTNSHEQPRGRQGELHGRKSSLQCRPWVKWARGYVQISSIHVSVFGLHCQDRGGLS